MTDILTLIFCVVGIIGSAWFFIKQDEKRAQRKLEEKKEHKTDESTINYEFKIE